MTYMNNANENCTIEKKCVLIVDDEKDFVLSLQDILESRNYQVYAAHSTQEALDIIGQFHVQVVLLDIRLGEENGIELIGKLHTKRPEIITIMMTAYADINSTIAALQKGAYDYLRKPLDGNDLLLTLDRCFDKIALRSDKKVAESALKKSKDEWEKTFDAMTDLVTIQDKDMKIVRANKATYDFFQAEPEEIIGRKCYELFRGRDHPCPDCPGFIGEDDRKFQGIEVRHENRGKVFWVTFSPILDEHGGFTHVVHIAKDITEQRRLEEELFQAHKMEAMGTLAGGIAHDFNNILTSIMGYAQLANLASQKNPVIREYTDQVLKAGERAKDLVQQILTLSRKSPKKKKVLQPAIVVHEVLKLLRASLPSTVKIHHEIAPDSGTILAAPSNIHQVLMNLCTNALHSMENEKGELTVKLTRTEAKELTFGKRTKVLEGDLVELVVKDTGCGMSKAVVERIFEPYFTTKEEGKGSGIGLALVHGIVEGAGGVIQVESKLGEGSTFHVYFPEVQDEPDGIKTKYQSSLSKDSERRLVGGRERILFVDDEESIVNLYKVALERLGYDVTTGSNSEEVLTTFLSSPSDFDLLITDQTMPNLTGLELAKRILHVKPDFPIILCTGYSSVLTESAAEKIGRVKVMMKPVNVVDLTQVMRNILDENKKGRGESQ